MMFAAPGRSLRRICLALLVCFPLGTAGVFSGTPPPKNTVIEQEAHPMYLGTITGGVKTSDVYTEGNFSIVAPVWSTLGADATLNGDIIYLEPYTSWGERGEVAASLGLGWRHLFGSQAVSVLAKQDAPQAGFFDEGIFVGANVFIDMLDTEADNQFWQLGVGVEVGTRYVEVRGNYYIPLSERQLAKETRVRQSFTSSQASTSIGQQVGAPGPLTAAGNGIGHDVNVTTTSVTTIRSTTTTIEQLFRRYEEGMEGWDAEMAFLIPGLDRYFDFRIIGGYYSFDNQPFGPQEGGTGNVEGWKAGVEIRPVPAVILTGTWYEDERLTGSDWTVGVQLQVPFEPGDLGDGKGFWDRIGDSFKPRRRHLIERLAEPVHRQNAAIKLASEVEQETEVVSEKTSVQRVTRVTQSTQRIVIADDIIFVNNGGPVGNGIAQAGAVETGVAEQPFNTIQEAADQAALNNAATQRVWTVYTQGAGAHGGGAYSESVTLGASTRFISSETVIESPLGGSIGTGDRPLVVGGVVGKNSFIPGATAPSLVEIRGYDFTQGYQSVASISKVVPGLVDANDHAIYLDGVDNVVVVGNHIDHSLQGVAILKQDGEDLDLTFTGNRVTDTITFHGVGIVVQDGITGQIRDNVSSANSDGIGFFIAAGGAFEGDIAGNIANENAVHGFSFVATDFTGAFSGNTATDNQRMGIRFRANDELNGQFTDNAANGNGADGPYDGMEVYAARMVGDFDGNTAHENSKIGMNIEVGMLDGSISGNQAIENGTGMSLKIDSISGKFSGNTLQSNTGDGLVVAKFLGTLEDNEVTFNGGAGIRFTGTAFGVDSSSSPVTFFGPVFHANNVSDNGGDGITTKAGRFTFTENTVNRNGGNGVYVDGGPTTAIAYFENNTLNENGDAGIRMRTILLLSTEVRTGLKNNTTNNNGTGVSLESSFAVSAFVEGHTALENEGDGIWMSGTVLSPGLFSDGRAGVIDSNLSNNGNDGLSISGSIRESGLVISGNTASGNGGSGIISPRIEGDMSFTGNITNLNGSHGVALFSDHRGIDANIEGNTASSNGQIGINIRLNSFRGFLADNEANSNGADGINLITASSSDSGVEQVFGDVTGNVTNGNSGIGIFVDTVLFTGSFFMNTSNNNTSDGYRTDVDALPLIYNGNTAIDNGGINFNNLNQPLANP